MYIHSFFPLHCTLGEFSLLPLQMVPLIQSLSFCHLILLPCSTLSLPVSFSWFLCFPSFWSCFGCFSHQHILWLQLTMEDCHWILTYLQQLFPPVPLPTPICSKPSRLPSSNSLQNPPTCFNLTGSLILWIALPMALSSDFSLQSVPAVINSSSLVQTANEAPALSLQQQTILAGFLFCHLLASLAPRAPSPCLAFQLFWSLQIISPATVCMCSKPILQCTTTAGCHDVWADSGFRLIQLPIFKSTWHCGGILS